MCGASVQSSLASGHFRGLKKPDPYTWMCVHAGVYVRAIKDKLSEPTVYFVF